VHDSVSHRNGNASVSRSSHSSDERKKGETTLIASHTNPGRTGRGDYQPFIESKHQQAQMPVNMPSWRTTGVAIGGGWESAPYQNRRGTSRFCSSFERRMRRTIFICAMVGATFNLRHTADGLLLVGPLAAMRSTSSSSRGSSSSSSSFMSLSSEDADDKQKNKATYDNDAELDRQISSSLARAKALIEKSKGSETTTSLSSSSSSTADMPYFATMTVDREQRMIKAKDAKTGLITADGEAMAAISEQEVWEARPLSEVFQSEVGEKEDIYSLVSQQLNQRDVAASVVNLRKQLQQEDYQRIFDKQNYFIGEDV
jgi:hypothetical protein